jgi:hypothetical protein
MDIQNFDVNKTISDMLKDFFKMLSDLIQNIKLPDNENRIGIISGSLTDKSYDDFSRPANTTAYAIGDAISQNVNDTATTPLRGIIIGRKNKRFNTGYITKLRLWTSQVACVAVIRIHFYKKSVPASAVVGDNVQMTLLYGNRYDRIGSVDMPALATSSVATSSTASQSLDITSRLPFNLADSDMMIYYRLETLTVFTPDSAQQFFLELTADIN